MNQNLYSRRSMLLGSLALTSLLNRENHAQEKNPTVHRGLPALPHFMPRAKRVIYLFQSGGPAQMDLYDYKPELKKRFGEEVPRSIYPDERKTTMSSAQASFPVAPSTFNFKRCGQAGSWISEALPHIGSMADDLCIIRSMHTDHSNHYNATLGMHTGSFAFARPSLGSWVSYGLGTTNQNLPSFITIAPKQTYAGTQVYSSDFLPGAHQGTFLRPSKNPFENIVSKLPKSRQELELEALNKLNHRHLLARSGDANAEARIKSFETAFGMQMEVPDVFDFSKETDATHNLYGLSKGSTEGFGWQCLAARRLIERGVRFVELIDTGSSGNWDSHGNMMDHERLAKNVDQPIAGLLRDLKSRGMMEDTLVVWTTEFGRTPFNNKADAPGREHHNWAFSSWMAGAGIRPGIVHGSTDEYGVRPEKNPVHVHDFHATILNLLGLDHEKLTYRHDGRDYRLTDVYGNVVTDIIA